MLKSQEVAIEAAEHRARLNDLLGKAEDDLSDEERADLEGGASRLASLEKRRAAALAVEASEGVEDRESPASSSGDGEGREVIELRSKFRLGAVVGALLGGSRSTARRRSTRRLGAWARIRFPLMSGSGPGWNIGRRPRLRPRASASIRLRSCRRSSIARSLRSWVSRCRRRWSATSPIRCSGVPSRPT